MGSDISSQAAQAQRHLNQVSPSAGELHSLMTTEGVQEAAPTVSPCRKTPQVPGCNPTGWVTPGRLSGVVHASRKFAVLMLRRIASLTAATNVVCLGLAPKAHTAGRTEREEQHVTGQLGLAWQVFPYCS
eukprot:GHRQ01007726.1.p1 GENE.GHRQ01007726.1~~GHRQ01007726.1.p1  ORF type:complete len:130 (+),score=2.08 GHRQ01007726.1:52-441(+)